MRKFTIRLIAFSFCLCLAAASGEASVMSDQKADTTAPLAVSLMFGHQVQQPPQPPQPPPEVQPPQPPVDLNIEIDVDAEEAWYTDPVWLAIGGMALLIVILAIAFGSRGGTTVVRG